MSTILVGTGRSVINPPIGDHLRGYSTNIKSTGIHDDLTVTALYLKSADRHALLLTFDLGGPKSDLIDKIRKAVSDRTNVPMPNVFFTFTHTHCAPYLRPMDSLSDECNKAVVNYCKKLETWSVDAADQALGNIEECNLRYNYTTADLNMNRRYTLPNREMLYIPSYKHLAGQSDGYVDRELGIIAFKRVGTANLYKAIITNYTAHPLCVGNSSTLISADYHAYIRKTIEETLTDCTVITTTGAAGDIHPLKPECGFDYCQHFGATLGSQIIKRLYDSAEVTYDTQLRMAYEPITLKPKDKATAALFPTEIERESELAKLADAPDQIKTSYSLLGIGPILLCGIPGEPVAKLGAILKWSSPFLKTYLLYWATDSINYIVTSNQYYWGGYEANSALVAQGEGEHLINTAVDTSRRLLREDPINLSTIR